MESRRRKKEHFSTVEGDLTTTRDENDELKKRVAFLERQNINLMTQLKRLQESVMAVSVTYFVFVLVKLGSKIVLDVFLDSEIWSCMRSQCGYIFAVCILLPWRQRTVNIRFSQF